MTDDLGATIGEITQRLEAAGIPYMVVGSIAALVHGRARATMDVDIVIDPDRGGLRAFVTALPSEDFYADVDVALDALQRRTQFNIIDQRSGWKVDLLICKARGFSREELARRTSHTLFGRPVMIASVEDVVVAKLEWARMGASERQLDDARALVELTGARLDRAYVERQVGALGLSRQWAAILASLAEAT